MATYTTSTRRSTATKNRARVQLILEDSERTFFSVNKPITNKTDKTIALDNTDGFLKIAEFQTEAKGDNVLEAPKALCLYNTGPVPIEVQIGMMTWANASENDGSTAYQTMIINPGDFYYTPTGRTIKYDNATSGANANTLSDVLPSDTDTATASLTGTGAGPFYIDTGVNVNASEPDTETDIVFQSTGKFRPGDILALDSGGGTAVDEFIRIVSVDSATNCTVERGYFGTTAQSLSSSTDVYFYFHNHLYDVATEDDSSTHIRTDANGSFTSKNFFGYGRSADATPQGLVPGSVAIKFFPPVHRKFGLSINTNDDTGLTAGTTYEFRVTTITGTTADIAVTIDSSNTRYGGANGLIQKMNTAFRGSIATDFLQASILNGDIAITDRRGLKGNSVTMVAPADGTTIWGAGNIPAIASHEATMVSELPIDTIIDAETGQTHKDRTIYMFDDGKGNLLGVGNGTINYDSGEISFTGPYRAEFVISANYSSAHSGKMNTASNYVNIIQTISARSINSKIDSEVRVIVYT